VIKPFAAVGGPVVIGPLASRRFASYRAAGGRRCVARRPLAFDLHSLNRVMKPLLPMSRVAAPTKAFRTLLRSSTCLLVLAAAAGCTPHAAPAPEAPSLPALVQQVEIRRTDHGVPHILAENLRAAAFALAWVQLEDHGPGIIRGINAARGRSALVEGRGRVDADARARLRHGRAVETFELLQRDTRDVYTGFADGMNHYIRVHRATLPDWVQPDFTPYDVLARDIGGGQEGPMNAFRRRIEQNPADPAVLVAGSDGLWQRAAANGARRRVHTIGSAVGGLADEVSGADAAHVGSNAWALAPATHHKRPRDPAAQSAPRLDRRLLRGARPRARQARLLRRLPHRRTVHGHRRIQSAPRLRHHEQCRRSHEFYAFRSTPRGPTTCCSTAPRVPLQRDVVTVEYRTVRDGGTETREFWPRPSARRPPRPTAWSTSTARRDGEYRAGEQWLEMMKARSLDEWKDAMRIGARTTSNFTYADRAGNIFYVWVSAAPLLPHPPGGDTSPSSPRADQVWARLAPFDSLPQLLNPPAATSATRTTRRTSRT
jgi:acyl-homoserine-lactone acylase